MQNYKWKMNYVRMCDSIIENIVSNEIISCIFSHRWLKMPVNQFFLHAQLLTSQVKFYLTCSSQVYIIIRRYVLSSFYKDDRMPNCLFLDNFGKVFDIILFHKLTCECGKAQINRVAVLMKLVIWLIAFQSLSIKTYCENDIRQKLSFNFHIISVKMDKKKLSGAKNCKRKLQKELPKQHHKIFPNISKVRKITVSSEENFRTNVSVPIVDASIDSITER